VLRCWRCGEAAGAIAECTEPRGLGLRLDKCLADSVHDDADALSHLLR